MCVCVCVCLCVCVHAHTHAPLHVVQYVLILAVHGCMGMYGTMDVECTRKVCTSMSHIQF